MRKGTYLRRQITAAAALLIFLGVSCTPSNPELNVGGVYSVRDPQGNYRVVKILALDEFAVNVRLYSKTYSSRPEKGDASLVSLESNNDEEGYADLSRRTFPNWKPELIKQSPVTAEEMEKYKTWELQHGGGTSTP